MIENKIDKYMTETSENYIDEKWKKQYKQLMEERLYKLEKCIDYIYDIIVHAESAMVADFIDSRTYDYFDKKGMSIINEIKSLKKDVEKKLK